MPYTPFFQAVTGNPAPFPYQRRLAEGPWPDLLDVPTGLGKTAAVVVAWLWKRLERDPATGRRLVYCLPMRTLVEQTRSAAAGWCLAAAPFFAERRLAPPAVSVLMGGDTEAGWDVEPERPLLLVGTQDMLLSRALDRGYGMSRFRWPVHYGLLHSDCLWVFDETQLMGVGVETSAQLQAFRDAFGTLGPARSLWMSATLGTEQLETVDHPQPAGGWSRHELTADDRREEPVRQRTAARKRLHRATELTISGQPEEGTSDRIAERVATAATARGGLTLVVVNRVARAQALYRAVRGRLAPDVACALLHSRFRRADRKRQEALLAAEGPRVIVSTQVVEAGVDVSARTLFTELAPWPSLVQRFGRVNRYGEADGGGQPAEIHWIPLEPEEGKDDLALPYEAAELVRAAGILDRLEAAGGDAGPEILRGVDYEAPPVVRPVLRRRDLLDLFDTTPDLLGYDVDISRFVRDGEDTDIELFWRDFALDEDRPPQALTAPGRDELCRVSIAAARSYLIQLDKVRRRFESKGKDARERARLLRAWRWDPLIGRWDAVRGARPADTHLRPGETLLLHASAEGYDPAFGWTGEWTGKRPVEVAVAEPTEPPESTGDDRGSSVGRWVLLTDHLAHVEAAARRVAREVGLNDDLAGVLATAGRWHDVGKAHEQFQRRLLGPLDEHPERAHPGPGPWAKSDHHLRAQGVRRYFRHELASALAWLARNGDGDARRHDLVAFLVAAHHGKVRLALRSLPEEQTPEVADTLFACGVWDGDRLEGVVLPGGEALPSLRLDLSPMRLGEGSWAERMLALRDDPALGPFRLAYLEALLRAADGRASAAEEAGDGAEETHDA